VFFAIQWLVFCSGVLFVVGSGVFGDMEYKKTVRKKHDCVWSMYPTDPARDIAETMHS
jgi:hypothetical protein